MVFDRILRQMRERVRSRQYVMSLHAEEEMVEDGLSIFDVESAILTGEIIERQKDVSSAEWKYLVKGKMLSGNEIIVVAKLGLTGKLILITVFRQ